MRSILGVASAWLVAAALGAPAAHAAPVRDCGDFYANPLGNGVMPVVTNITTRNVTCADARAFVRKLWRQGMPYRSGWIRVPGWRPYRGSYRTFDHGWRADLRATRDGGRVIRFQYWTDYC